MRMLKLLAAVAAAALAAWLPLPAAAQTTLNVVTAGDQNMVDYVNDYLGAQVRGAESRRQGRAVGTGPGDAGSQKIYEKLSAQQKAGVAAWDIDVAVVHQRGAGDDGEGERCSRRTRNDIAAGKLVSRDSSKNALGAERRRLRDADVPQPDRVRLQPGRRQGAAEELRRARTPGSQKNPKQFGYNGVKGGMSGVGFVMGWVAANSGIGDQLEKGPYDPAKKAAIDKSLASLKEFNQNVVLTPGNAGTLDMLNRGEIAMGPVWVDMFYTWLADGKMNPKVKLALPSPGLPGQPMYYVIPAKAANAALAKKFVDFAASPEIQAEGIVKQFNWYPGIDAQYVKSKLDAEELEQAVHRHPAGRALATTASRSRCRSTSPTSSRATSGWCSSEPMRIRTRLSRSVLTPVRRPRPHERQVTGRGWRSPRPRWRSSRCSSSSRCAVRGHRVPRPRRTAASRSRISRRRSSSTRPTSSSRRRSSSCRRC